MHRNWPGVHEEGHVRRQENREAGECECPLDDVPLDLDRTKALERKAAHDDAALRVQATEARWR
jgi:hypothetical protein